MTTSEVLQEILFQTPVLDAIIAATDSDVYILDSKG